MREMTLKAEETRIMKTVLITGGTRGIGREMVKSFSIAGYNVAFTYSKSASDAMLLTKEFGAMAILADSAVESDIISAVKEVKAAFGRIDCLINNAGVSSFSLFTEVSLDEWQRLISVNLNGAFLYSREVARDMISRHEGRIINISSMWGITGASCEVAYSTTKAALNGMTKALAKELGPSGITVNAIAPGLIDTEMNSNLSEDDIRNVINDTPMMRIGTPADVAALALFLAGDSASFITGEIISVNGGYVI